MVEASGCWYLQRNRIIPGFPWREMDFVHPYNVWQAMSFYGEPPLFPNVVGDDPRILMVHSLLELMDFMFLGLDHFSGKPKAFDFLLANL